MRRLNQIELEDALIGRRVEAVRVELSVAQAIRTDASPERHFAFESLRLFCVFRVEAHADGTLHVLAAVLAQVEVRFIAEHHTRPIVFCPATVALSEGEALPKSVIRVCVLFLSHTAEQADFVQPATDGACRAVQCQVVLEKSGCSVDFLLCTVLNCLVDLLGGATGATGAYRVSQRVRVLPPRRPARDCCLAAWDPCARSRFLTSQACASSGSLHVPRGSIGRCNPPVDRTVATEAEAAAAGASTSCSSLCSCCLRQSRQMCVRLLVFLDPARATAALLLCRSKQEQHTQQTRAHPK